MHISITKEVVRKETQHIHGAILLGNLYKNELRLDQERKSIRPNEELEVDLGGGLTCNIFREVYHGRNVIPSECLEITVRTPDTMVFKEKADLFCITEPSNSKGSFSLLTAKTSSRSMFSGASDGWDISSRRFNQSGLKSDPEEVVRIQRDWASSETYQRIEDEFLEYCPVGHIAQVDG